MLQSRNTEMLQQKQKTARYTEPGIYFKNDVSSLIKIQPTDQHSYININTLSKFLQKSPTGNVTKFAI